MDESAERTVDTSDAAEGKLGPRAARTRNAILQASKQLFLDRGYAGTRINNITDACGISRAGFYTYFRDKREIFNTLGEATYHELLEVIGALDDLPRPASRADLEGWIRRYFAFMDEHGAFILSAQSGPSDEDVRVASNRMQMRVAFLLGVDLRGRQKHPTAAPEALGLAAQAMMDRSWYHCRAQQLPIDEDDVIGVITDFFVAALAG
ncbi:TetR/AcrR family transcriptional regulator [Amycolatopsis acidiphila]|uniref:TetR/AcrR family transcriptional regulator n=1 Tax=Amycolatopsis acidiphila TaxID=715473 RepID=A0A558AA41_9PSEU|nr:TetR/AcrR family transcriptional regulator [Amycolatopsis acidiphila]TVT21129.1 TetR/AcrR family transcriptional regulator [Amycolatopsis acidiphila]UIJ57214.1 TetR/AcrR family transcriptional regulator [Amycolatopsis acidiphila]